MNTSNRHHYIPKFLIKNFAKDDGLIYVYNKEENKISKKSPKQIFFEWNRNTTDLSGSPSDHLENLYSELDTHFSKDVNNIVKNKIFTPEELASLGMLVSILKWRVPANDSQFNKLKNDTSQEDLAIELRVMDKNTSIDKSAISHIENSELFKESKRVLLGMLPFVTKNEFLLDLYQGSFVLTHKSYNSIIGDYPLIEKSNSDIRKIEDFIFPMSSNETFVYKRGCSRKIANSLFLFWTDLAIYYLAEKYVGCKDRNHLEDIIAKYNKIKIEGRENELLSQIFNLIEN